MVQLKAYLKPGSKDPLVRDWQLFLRGLDIYLQDVTGIYDGPTVEATKRFQLVHGLNPDGVAGNKTIGRAMTLGFDLIPDDSGDKLGPNWPPAPTDLSPMTPEERDRAFGSFSYKATPTSDNPEAIVILGSWVKDNITTVELPTLRGVPGAPHNGKIDFHKAVAKQLEGLFDAWEQAGLSRLILSWGGSFVPRFVRGSKTSLSNHSRGTAFDLNVPWNGLGTTGALVGQRGSIRELIPLANQHGFFCGLHYKGRKDPMHFEVARLLP
jgi:peptidoglycan hydrolase-like protein with peptidoglycan-binding domain